MRLKQMDIDGVQFGLATSLLVLMAAIGAWDLYAGYTYGFQATVSAILQRWAGEWPVLPLAVGLLLGHIFWPLRGVHGNQ